ncbi:patatin-like phospholipase family protein [Chloroflexota bacterium]
MQRPRVGLALGGGGARGLAHIGVLEVLQEAEIPIDMIAGASVGAAIGAIYAQGKDANLIENLAMGFNWRKMLSLVDLAFPRTGLIQGGKIADLLQLVMGGRIKFTDLKIQLACVATDLSRCEEVVIDEGSVIDAVRASISIPGIFSVLKHKGRYLVDGSLINPVPVNILKRKGIDFVIAVNVIPDFRDRHYQAGKQDIIEFKKPNIFSVIMQSTQIAQCALLRSCLESAEVVIKPQVAHIGVADFRQVRECITQGRQAAKDCVLEIKRRLGIVSDM